MKDGWSLERANKKRQGATSMKAIIKRFVRDETGATAIEYGLIAAGIALVIIPAVKGVGTHLSTTFTTVSNALK